MTRFTAIALALLLVVPAKAADCPILSIYPEYNADFSCASLRCSGMRLLRDAYLRGDIKQVHLARKSECDALSGFDPATGTITPVPCTWDQNDWFVK